MLLPVFICFFEKLAEDDAAIYSGRHHAAATMCTAAARGYPTCAALASR